MDMRGRRTNAPQHATVETNSKRGNCKGKPGKRSVRSRLIRRIWARRTLTFTAAEGSIKLRVKRATSTCPLPEGDELCQPR